MPTVLVLVALAVVAGATIALVGRNRAWNEAPIDTSEDWLDAARAALRDGDRLSTRVTASAERSPSDLPDSVLADTVSEIKDFNARIAALSATAPTAMDNRVCREVGVRAHALCDVYERQLRLREAPGAEDRPTPAGDTLQDGRRRLDEFEVALHDLETHVELL